MKLLARIHRLLLIGAIALIGIYVGMQIHRAIMSRTGLLRFEKARAEAHVAKSEGLMPEPSQKVDFKSWSEKRIAAYEQSLLERFDPPLAVLRIAKLNLEVPVLEGTDDLTLNRGVGHIAGTVRPGEEGNTGIAGHRDGFFRVLKDIAPGDAIELVTRGRRDMYRVEQIILVHPNDVSVLQSRPGRWLTLVTCYPFYFIGSAPQRYIVQASLTDSEGPPNAGSRANEVATSKN